MKMKINAPSKPRPSYVSRMCEKKWENCQWLWTGSYESFLGGRGAGEGGGENTWVVIGAPTTWRHRKVRETKEDRSSSSGERRGEEKEWKDGKVREEVTALSEPEEGQTLITWTIRWIQADENKKPSRIRQLYLHRTTAELFIQLSAEDRTGSDFILTGVHSLPGRQKQTHHHYTEYNKRPVMGFN